MASTDQTHLTFAEAAARCGCHEATIRRRQREGALPGTRRRPGNRRGVLEIPISDLVACGLLPSQTVLAASPGAVDAGADAPTLEPLGRHALQDPPAVASLAARLGVVEAALAQLLARVELLTSLAAAKDVA